MSPRRIAVLVLDLILLATIAGLTAWWSTRPGDEPPLPAPEAARAAAIAATQSGRRAQAREVRSTLRRLEDDPDGLVASSSRATVGDRARQAVPRGSKVTPSQRSWSPDGNGGGTMKVKVAPPGARPVTYVAVMLREAGGWKVAATLPVSGR
jgi:hypothetical protein